jgi:peptidoglycan/xylan/chitin deacetylase (PgdA/CDA1 family)
LGVVEAALVSAAAAVSVAAYAVRGKSSSLVAPSVWHGDRNRRAVALTFDDGPSESTPALLDLLARFDAKATFFMCGANVRRLPQIARRVADAGHEIGNHTETHPPLYFKSPAFIEREIARAQDSIAQATGVTPRLFRAPFGVRWPGLRAAQQRHRLTGVMWTIIGRDWKLTAPQVADLVLRNTRNGAIFCLHDGRALTATPDIRATLDAVRIILPALREQGFAFETVSGIL